MCTMEIRKDNKIYISSYSEIPECHVDQNRSSQSSEETHASGKQTPLKLNPNDTFLQAYSWRCGCELQKLTTLWLFVTILHVEMKI